MRSVLQRKDIFLSYAHMNIEFARRIKVSLLDMWVYSWNT